MQMDRGEIVDSHQRLAAGATPLRNGQRDIHACSAKAGPSFRPLPPLSSGTKAGALMLFLGW